VRIHAHRLSLAAQMDQYRLCAASGLCKAVAFSRKTVPLKCSKSRSEPISLDAAHCADESKSKRRQNEFFSQSGN
jgi:hypothetical protein